MVQAASFLLLEMPVGVLTGHLPALAILGFVGAALIAATVLVVAKPLVWVVFFFGAGPVIWHRQLPRCGRP